MRRWVVFACSVVGPIALVAFGACGGEERSDPPAIVDATADTPLLGETSPPEPDAEPDPGDVCGLRGGLMPSAPWPLRGGCPTRAGRASVSGPQSATVSATVPALAGESSPAVTSNGLVWVGTTDGWVLAISNIGEIRWAHKTGGAIKSSPALDVAGHAIVAGGDGVLYSLSAIDDPPEEDAGADGGDAGEADGGDAGDRDGGSPYPPAKVVFARPIGPMASSPVIGPDGTIYVGTTAGKLAAVAKDGSAVRWSVTTNDTQGSSPALGQDGTIYIGSSDGKLYAVTPAGTTKWAVGLGASIQASPSVGGDGTVYIGTTDGKLHAVRPDGTERWAYATAGPITASAAVYAGVVYIGSEDKKLHAVSTVDGKVQWTYATLGAVATPVIGSDGTVYVGSADARLYAITGTGKLYFAVNARGPIKSAPGLGIGPALYVTTANAVVAVGP